MAQLSSVFDLPRRMDSSPWFQFIHLVKDHWQRKLFVIDEHLFRVGDLIQTLLLFFLILFLTWLVKMVAHRTLLRRLRTRADASDALTIDSLLAVVRQTKRLFVILIAGYFALITLPLSPSMDKMLDRFAMIVVTVQVAFWANAVFHRIIERAKKTRVEADPSAVSAFGLMGFFLKVAVWSAALLLMLTNLGYEIGPLLAGLGVGGVAVAFALQSILGDIFCSIAIVLDKPFVIGDFIIVNEFLGTVENIGIKTTRIRSLSGEQIIFSNADLIGSRVRNYKRMYERRVVFSFGIVYETQVDQLERIPALVQELINGIEQTRFDRAHFREYGDFSLVFEVVYYVLSPDYNMYMDIQQEINLGLFRKFKELGIAFAYPTHEIIMRPNGFAISLNPPMAEQEDSR